MKTEFEIRFLDIKEDEFRDKLTKLGAKLTKPRLLMRRQTLDFPVGTVMSGQKKWARVRDQGGNITLTIKHVIDKNAIDGTKETEVKVDNFDNACDLMESAGLYKASYQENFREEWELNSCIVTIDTWPGLKPFVEIEAESQEIVEKLALDLGFNLAEGKFGSIDLIYSKAHNITVEQFNKISVLTFKNYSEFFGQSN